MPRLSIVCDIDTMTSEGRPAPAAIVHLPDPDLRIIRVPRGMQSGASSVMIEIPLPDGRVLLAETSMALFLACAAAFVGAEERAATPPAPTGAPS